MNQPASFAEEQPVRALDRAYDEYINEVGAPAVAAQFGLPVESIEARKLKPEIAFFLFERQAEIHRSQLEAAGPRGAEPATEVMTGGPLPGMPRMIPMRERGSDWITPRSHDRDRGRDNRGPLNSPIV